MKEFTIRPRFGDRSFKLLEKTIGGKFTDFFIGFFKKYSGLGLVEDYFIDCNNIGWTVASFDNFGSMYKLTKEFKENGWGNKLPFAYDPGGWHFCLSFDEDTYGKIIVNRWTDYDADEQFVVIADSFEEFIEGLHRRPD